MGQETRMLGRCSIGAIFRSRGQHPGASPVAKMDAQQMTKAVLRNFTLEGVGSAVNRDTGN